MINKICMGLVLFLLPIISFAEDSFGTIVNPVTTGITTIGGLFEVILKGITYMAIPIIVLWFIWTGFHFISAQGDSGKITTAKQMLMWGVIGAAIILGANVILDVVTGTAEELLKK